MVPDFQDDGTGAADTVVEAARLLIDEGMTAYQAADRLNAIGMSPRRAQNWRYYDLKRALQAEALMGRIEFGRTSSKDSVKFDLPHAVMDEKRWKQLQRGIGRTATGKRAQKRRTYQLSGRITSPCGRPYWGYHRKDGDATFYRCRWSFRNERPTGEPSCGWGSVKAKDVEDAVWDQVSALFENPDRLLEAADTYPMAGAGEEGTMRDALASVDQEIRVLEDGISAGLANALRGGHDPQLMRRAVEDLERELAGKLEYRAQLSARLEQSTAESDRLQRLSELSERIRSMDSEERAQVLELLDIHVEVLDSGSRKEAPKLRITGHVTDEFELGVGEVKRGTPQRR